MSLKINTYTQTFIIYQNNLQVFSNLMKKKSYYFNRPLRRLNSDELSRIMNKKLSLKQKVTDCVKTHQFDCQKHETQNREKLAKGSKIC